MSERRFEPADLQLERCEIVLMSDGREGYAFAVEIPAERPGSAVVPAQVAYSMGPEALADWILERLGYYATVWSYAVACGRLLSLAGLELDCASSASAPPPHPSRVARRRGLAVGATAR